MTFRGLILLVPVVACSQNLTVSEIAHKGNTFTKDYIISREIQHRVGIPLDSIIAEEDKKSNAKSLSDTVSREFFVGFLKLSFLEV